MKPERGPQTMFWGNFCSGIPGLANYECQAKCAKASFGDIFRHRDSRSGRNGCHGYLWSLGKWA